MTFFYLHFVTVVIFFVQKNKQRTIDDCLGSYSINVLFAERDIIDNRIKFSAKSRHRDCCIVVMCTYHQMFFFLLLLLSNLLK